MFYFCFSLHRFQAANVLRFLFKVFKGGKSAMLNFSK